jgi:hypothetical protein
MKRLRDALGDSADTPRFVETLARRGYRFIAPVELVERSSQAISRPVEAPPPPEAAEGEQFSPPRPVGKVLLEFLVRHDLSRTFQKGLKDEKRLVLKPDLYTLLTQFSGA